MHNASLIQMGTTQSSFKAVDNMPGVIAAGKIVRLKSDDTIVVTAADGAPLGVSLGRSLSDTSRTAIVRRGTRVPVLLTNGLTPVIGAAVTFSDTTGLAASSGTAMNAVYATSTLSAVDEDGVAIADGCALIDFPGGL